MRASIGVRPCGAKACGWLAASARIFGPDSAPAAADAAPNLVPKVVSKAYEAIDGSGKSGAFRQSA